MCRLVPPGVSATFGICSHRMPPCVHASPVRLRLECSPELHLGLCCIELVSRLNQHHEHLRPAVAVATRSKADVKQPESGSARSNRKQAQREPEWCGGR